MQTVCPHFDISIGCLVFGLGLFAFQKITLGIYLSFFIIGGRGCLCLRLRGVLLCSFVGFALTAVGSFIFADTGVGMYIVNSLDCMGYPFL